MGVEFVASAAENPTGVELLISPELTIGRLDLVLFM